jgi:hypothetical protein
MSMKSVQGRGLLLSAFLGCPLAAVGCGAVSSPSPRAATAVNVSAEPQPQKSEVAAEPAHPVEKAVEAPSSAAEPVPQEKGTSEPQEPSFSEKVATTCENHCAKVEGACKAQTAEVCRANCESYVIQAERCPVEVFRAISCRTDAEDVVLCSAMVPDVCTKNFERMRDCVAGKVASEAPSEAETDRPQGFELVESSELGISLFLPSGSAVAVSEKGPRLGATRDGIEYFAELVPGASSKPSDKTILRAALGYLGHECESKLKLHGRFDKDSVIFVRFDTSCKDSTVWHGMFVVRPDKMVSVAARRGAGVTTEFGELEPFLFGVRTQFEKK